MYNYWDNLDSFASRIMDDAVANDEFKNMEGKKVIAYHDPFRQYKTAQQMGTGSKIYNTIAYHDREVFSTSEDYKGYLIGNYGTVIDEHSGLKLSHFITQNGHHQVKLMTTRKPFNYVDRVVLNTYEPNKDAIHMRIKHHDGNNNNIYYHPEHGNLSWDGYTSIMDESKYKKLVKNQSRFSGQNAYNAIYSNAEIATICEALVAGLSREDAVLAAGLTWDQETRALVTKIVTKEKWRTISQKFPEVYDLANTRGPVDQHEEKEIRTICDLISRGITDEEIIKMLRIYGYGTKISYVHHIRLKDIHYWKRILDEYTFPRLAGDRVELTNMEVHSLCRNMIAGGRSRYDIALESGKFDNRSRQMVEEFMRKLLLNFHRTYDSITSLYFPIDPMQVNLIYHRIQNTSLSNEEIAEEVTTMGYTTSPLLVEAIREVGSSPEATIKGCTVVAASSPHKRREFTEADIEKICKIMIEAPDGKKAQCLRNTGLFNDFSNDYLKLFMKNLRKNKVRRYVHITSKYFT